MCISTWLAQSGCVAETSQDRRSCFISELCSFFGLWLCPFRVAGGHFLHVAKTLAGVKMRGACGRHFVWQAQYLVNLDDVLKGLKIAFCETVVEFDLGHDDDSAWQALDFGCLGRAHFSCKAQYFADLEKSGWDLGGIKPPFSTYSLFMFRGARNFCENLTCQIALCCGAVLILRSPVQPSDRWGCGAVLMLIIKDILRRDHDKQIFPRGPSQRSCQKSSYTELLQRSQKEILPRSCTEILPRDLFYRFCAGILPGDLLIIEILFRELVKRTEILLTDLFERAWTEIFLQDLLQRSSSEISYRHLVQIALQRDLAQQLLQRTCQGDLAHDLLQRSSQGNLQNLALFFMFLATLFGVSCWDNRLLSLPCLLNKPHFLYSNSKFVSFLPHLRDSLCVSQIFIPGQPVTVQPCSPMPFLNDLVKSRHMWMASRPTQPSSIATGHWTWWRANPSCRCDPGQPLESFGVWHHDPEKGQRSVKETNIIMLYQW